MTRVLLVDDHASFRQPLAFMLEREEDLTVVGQAGSIAEARPFLRDTDVAIIDLDLPDGNGISLVSQLRQANPRAVALILTGADDRQDLAHAVEQGAAGLVHKSSPISEIIAATRTVAAGESLLSSTEMMALLRYAVQQREHDRVAHAAIERLTPREREVLQALAEGLSDKDMATHLHVSTETVRTHMVNILGKLGVESRLQALVFAVRHGAVEIR